MEVVVKKESNGVINMCELKKGEYAVIVDDSWDGDKGIVVFCAYAPGNSRQFIGLTDDGSKTWDVDCKLLVRKLKASELQFVD